MQPKYQHARNTYLERSKVFSPQDLHWKTRLAVPPVSTLWLERVDMERGGRVGTGGAGTIGGNKGGSIAGDNKKK